MERAAVFEGSVLLTARAMRTSLTCVVSLFLFLCAWHWRVVGELSPPACAALALLLALYLLYGHLFATASARLFRNTVGLPYQLLCGYFMFNTALFVLALCSPFGMSGNVAFLGGCGVAAAYALRKHVRPVTDAPASDAWAPWLVLMIAATGATIWSGDIQSPLQVQGDKTIFKVWPDVYIHVREISVFAQAHGLQTIHDIKLAGGPAPLYHFASYLSAAAISALGGASAMQVYASFQLPFGVLLTGLAAYCLVGKLLGRWPGVAAAAAVVLLPDGFHQGFANRYLSYYFMSQVNLGMLYGIACAALAWLFVLDGCRRGKLQTLARSGSAGSSASRRRDATRSCASCACATRPSCSSSRPHAASCGSWPIPARYSDGLRKSPKSLHMPAAATGSTVFRMPSKPLSTHKRERT